MSAPEFLRLPRVKRIRLWLYRVIIPASIVVFGLWFWVSQPLWSEGSRATQQVNPDELRRHVQTLSVDFAPRSHISPNLKASADYIAAEFGKTKAKVERQTFTVDGKTFENVVAKFGSGNGKLIVVGAHYDGCSSTPGADDNASGVAGLIELAKLLDAENHQNVELVAYSLEEPPFFRTESMGSFFHAKGLSESKPAVKGVIILEMIGYFSDKPDSQNYPIKLLKLFYPSAGDFIALVGRWDQVGYMRALKGPMKGATDLPVYSVSAPAFLPGVDFSDHLNYWRYGYNAVMVTDTAFYRNPNYHDPADTWDTLDYEKMAKVVLGTYTMIQNSLRDY